MQDVYKNINEYNRDKKRKISIVFDDMIADMIKKKKLNSKVTVYLNILLFFKFPKDVGLNATHFFIIKIPNERELKQIAINHASDIDSKDFITIYKKYAAKPYSFLVNDNTLASDNPLLFTKNLFNI